MDTLVIGAGLASLAGLAAAERLVAAGAAVTLIEARARLGGRVWTERRPSGGTVELGAEWIGNEGAVHDLLARVGARLVEARGAQVTPLSSARPMGSGAWSKSCRRAYSYVKVGGVEAHRTLAEPVAGTLYFAGEATRAGGLNATMEGAMGSGVRAATELLAGSRR